MGVQANSFEVLLDAGYAKPFDMSQHRIAP